MSLVVMRLAGENATLLEPNEPGVNLRRNMTDTGFSENKSEFTMTTTDTR